MLESFKPTDYFTLGLGGHDRAVALSHLLKDTVGVVGAGLLLGTLYRLTLAFIFTRDIGIEVERMFASFHAWRARRAQLRRGARGAEEEGQGSAGKGPGLPQRPPWRRRRPSARSR